MGLKKHVITGGPCTGKTTTLEALRRKGFAVVEEASRLLIEEANRTGSDLVPWKRLLDFNVALTEKQRELESQARDGVHFLDRGIIDNLAYCELGGIRPPENLMTAVKTAAYDTIFLLEPLPFYEKDGIRTESREEQTRLHNALKRAYHSQGYAVIEVPPLSVEERVAFILKQCNAVG